MFSYYTSLDDSTIQGQNHKNKETFCSNNMALNIAEITFSVKSGHSLVSVVRASCRFAENYNKISIILVQFANGLGAVQERLGVY